MITVWSHQTFVIYFFVLTIPWPILKLLSCREASHMLSSQNTAAATPAFLQPHKSSTEIGGEMQQFPAQINCRYFSCWSNWLWEGTTCNLRKKFACTTVYSRNLLDVFLVVGTQEGWGVWLHLHSVTSVCSHNPYIGLLTHHFFHLSRVTEDAAVLNLYSELFTVPDHSVSVMLWVWFSKKELLNRCL